MEPTKEMITIKRGLEEMIERVFERWPDMHPSNALQAMLVAVMEVGYTIDPEFHDTVEHCINEGKNLARYHHTNRCTCGGDDE